MFFDIGFPELLMIAVVGLLVIGPERLPEALRTMGLWLGRLRRSFTAVKAEIEKEIGMDDIKRQLHNEAVMEEMQRIEQEVQNSIHEGVQGNNQIEQETATAGVKEEQDSQLNSEETNPETSGSESDKNIEPLADTTPLPPTEAELEAAYERKQRAQNNQ